MDEDDADLLGIETAVAPRHAAHEVVELGRHLDARESPAGDHEGEELAAQFRIVILDGSFLEGADDVAAQMERVGQVLERHRVLGQAAQAAEIRDVAERDHQMVVGDRVRVRAEARAGHHHLARQVDRFDLAHVDVGARQQPAQRANRVGQADGSGDHLRQHRLEDEVVLLADERDLEVALPSECLLERLRGVNAGESAAQHQHSFPRCRHARLDACR